MCKSSRGKSGEALPRTSPAPLVRDATNIVAIHPTACRTDGFRVHGNKPVDARRYSRGRGKMWGIARDRGETEAIDSEACARCARRNADGAQCHPERYSVRDLGTGSGAVLLPE